jgi:predicted dehydrogenase/nucleoside-diphosphate-sugar epimerase
MQTADTILRKDPVSLANDVPKGDGETVQAANAGPAPSASTAKRVALIGAGYIAAVHAEALKATPGAKLVGVIDPRLDRAEVLARRNGAAAATSLARMLDSQPLDAVHVLTPPNLHTELTREALSRGLPVLLEKPMASEIEGAEELVKAAHAAGAPPLYVNHNFLFHPAFAQLAEMVKSRRCGRLISLSCIFAMPLRQLAAGQLQHWMFRRPANLLLEQAVHPFSQILSLTGPVRDWKVLAGAAYQVSAPSPIPRTLSVALAGENCEAQIYIHFGSTYPVWQITALCSDGVIKADMVQNRLVCEEMSENLEPVDNFIQAKRVGRELRRQTRSGLIAYGRSLLGLGKRSDSFYQTMTGSLGAFYRGERPWVNTPEGACEIVRLCEDIAAEAFPAPAIRSHAPVQTEFKPDAVVLGGTGFIGHHIVKALADRGMRVAAVSRQPVVRNSSENVRFLHGDIRDGEKLARLIGDAPFLINAAGPEITEDWAECERKVQDAITAVSDACRHAGVKRLVHLSSIAALYLGGKGEIVTGRAPVDPYGWQRANYSRAKGVEEIALLTKYEEGGLPVSILRPAIVVGEGGTPYHTGVGLFNNERHCMGWNEGLNPLPFVLGEDVASAVLAATEKDGILGHCYNLAGDVRLSARDYIAALGAALGRPLVFHPQSPGTMYWSEVMKWGIKRVGGRKVALPSKRDLLSRTMAATLDCADVKAALGWTPVSDRETFITRSIRVHADNRPVNDRPVNDRQ